MSNHYFNSANKKKILFISYHYPPISAPGAVRCARIIDGLLEADIDCSVITSRGGLSSRIGGLKDPLTNYTENCHRYRDPIAFLIRDQFQAKVSDVGRASTLISSIKTSLLRAFRFLQFPDRTVLWAISTAFRVSKSKALSASIVWSTSPDLSSHLLARFVAKKLNAKWVAEFRDPIVWTPSVDGISKLRFHLLSRLEKSIISHADQVVVISSTFAEHLENKYGNLNIAVIPNGAEFDMEVVRTNISKRLRRSTDLPFKILHAGSLYGGDRPPHSLIKACDSASKKTNRNIELHFVGNDSDIAAHVAKQIGCEIPVVAHGTKTHEATLKMMREADILVALLHDSSVAEIGIMSKFFDHIPTANPTLVLGSRTAQLSRIVTSHNAGACFEYSDIKGLVQWLLDESEFYRDTHDATYSLCESWSTKKMTNGVINVIDAH